MTNAVKLLAGLVVIGALIPGTAYVFSLLGLNI
jgi:hypothetical protein